MQAIRKLLTYANVMATVAVFLALGGGAYAALHLSKNSVGAKQLKKNSVTSGKIADGAVSSTKIADGTVSPVDAAPSLHLNCRSGTAYLQGACIQSQSAGAATWSNALTSCLAAGGRLPNPAELVTLVDRGVTNSQAEWTDTLSNNGTDTFAETVNLDGSGVVTLGFIANLHAYRCVFDPTG
jgi:hypothetical protein